MPDKKPNIIMIICDQWRGDALGIAGNQFVDTPNIDNLFYSGITFTQAYSAVPSCIAARAGLLTGLSQKNHGRVGYKDRTPWNYKTTLPGTLSDAGYHTHCVGKMHVFPARNLMGFNSIDLCDGYLHNERCRHDSDYSLVDDYLPWLREKLGSDVDITDAGVGCNGYSVTPWPYEERFHPTNWVTTKSIDFLRRRDPTKPFFLKMSYHRPHPPLDPPAHYLERYMNRELPPIAMGDWADKSSLEQRGLDSPVPISKHQIDLARRAYYAQLTHIDCQINRLTHALYEHELYNDTLILFTSDHGDMLYDHNMTAKSFPYSGSAHIPFLVKFPDAWDKPKNTQVDSPVELRDIMPTFLEAAGVDIPSNLDGESVLPLCNGDNSSWREYVHGEHSRGETSNQWITNGREMYVWFSQTGKEQLFNIEIDPNNLKDIANDDPERITYWRQKLVIELSDREEGYVQNGELVVGRTPKAFLDHVISA